MSFSGNAFVLKKDPGAELDAADAKGAKRVIATLIEVWIGNVCFTEV